MVHHVGAEPQHRLLDTLEDFEAAHGGSKRNTVRPLNTRPFTCTLRCMSERTRDLRVESFRPLLPPLILLEELPLSERGSRDRHRGRGRKSPRILRGEDDRLVVIVGPCSIHDPGRGARVRAAAQGAWPTSTRADLRIVMRVYFEKPRTTVGWKGLINDPRLDGSFAINEGLRRARRLLLDLAELGLPAGCEFLDPITPQFTSDLVDLGRHRRAHDREPGAPRAGLGPARCPSASRTAPTAACRSPSTPSAPPRIRTSFLGVTEQGLCAIVATRGNPDCHVILRGGASGPNYDAVSVQKTARGAARRQAAAAAHDRHEPRQQRARTTAASRVVVARHRRAGRPRRARPSSA